MKQPYRYGDLVKIKEDGGFLSGEDVVVINYELEGSASQGNLDFSYNVARLIDGQEAAWIDHNRMELIKEGDEESLIAARKAHKEFYGRMSEIYKNIQIAGGSADKQFGEGGVSP